MKNNFQEVDREFRVINANTATVVVNTAVVKALENGYADWKFVQKHSVQLWFNKIGKLELQKVRGCENDEIYSWVDSYEYDDFLGIYSGLIKPMQVFKNHGGVIN